MPSANYRGWSGGVNQSLPPDEIEDTQVAESLNMELDDKSRWRTRLGVNDVSGGSTLTNKVTSLVYFEQSDGSTSVLATEGDDIRRFDGTDTWDALSIDGGASFTGLPTDADWHWRQFGDALIGVNGDTGGTNGNPVMIDDASGSATLKELSSDANMPSPVFIEVMNNRVFFVDADEPNKVHTSKLGVATDADSWSATGIAGSYEINIGGNEGGRITAIKAYRNSLIVFKRRRIYRIQFGSPNTDLDQWEVIEITNNAGCISAKSVQEIVGDLVFLSDEGIMSLQALTSSQDAERALLSDPIDELRNVPRSVSTYPSVVIPQKSQYWIAIPDVSGSETTNGRVWVMDYGQRQVNGRVAWFPFDGAVVGASYEAVVDSTSGDIRLFVGSESVSGSSDIYRYHNEESCEGETVAPGTGSDCFSDAGSAYTSRITTKAFTFDYPSIRKIFRRWGMSFGAQTDPVVFAVKHRFDEDEDTEVVYNSSFAGSVSGGSWDVDDWDDANFASAVAPNNDIWRGFFGTPGRRGQSIQFEVERTTNKQGLRVRTLSIEFGMLNFRGVSEA